jgi:hypothetical protein
MSIRLYMDENVPKSVTEGLRRRGYDVLTPRDVGQLGIEDHLQLSLATQLERVLVTRDVDFLILASTGIYHAGIVFAGQHISIGDFISGLELIIGAMTADEMINRIEYV